MEKGLWSRDQQINWQSLNPDLLSARFSFGPQVVSPSYMVPPPVRQEPYGWFYGLPRYRQGLVPVVNSIVKEVKEKLPEASRDVGQETNAVPKKFLVFDQSGDQTTLIYSPGIRPVTTGCQFPSSNYPKQQFQSHTDDINAFTKENDSTSEMREDTEELNALLYSSDEEEEDDDDNEEEEEEEKSTGHSPNVVTGFHEQKLETESGEEEEVASSGGPMKKRKREDGGDIVNELMDSASSGKSGINCSGNGVFNNKSNGYCCGNKRMRKEKMKETINLIQKLIPGDHKDGKDGIMVIDEAIHYLRRLKVKVKALGLDSL